MRYMSFVAAGVLLLSGVAANAQQGTGPADVAGATGSGAYSDDRPSAGQRAGVRGLDVHGSPDTGSTGGTGSAGMGTSSDANTASPGMGSDATGAASELGTDATTPSPSPGMAGDTAETTVPITDATPTSTPMDQEAQGRRAAWLSRVGTALLVGGGFEDFTDNNLQNLTEAGGSWNARAVAGTRQFVGLEAAYVGSARNINALGLTNNAALVSNGVEGALRLNVPIMRGRSLVEPFGFVGLGWQHYNVANSATNTSDVAENDNVMTLPFGGGLEYAYGMFIADARFTYRQTYNNDLLRTTGGTLNNWGLSAQLGVEF